MTTNEVITIVVSAVVGGSGFVGLAFYFLRRYLERRLNEQDKEAEKRREIRVRRMRIEDEMQHAYGRLFFWLYRAITTGSHNGELAEAFEKLQEAEGKKKELDREIIAESEQE